MDAIEIKDITYKYPISNNEALIGVNLKVKKGELCAVIGPNGGGKTTLCNVIRGFVPNFYQGDMKGEVIIKGKNLKEYTPKELATSIGFVFQNPFSQISGIKDTVFEEIAFGLENLGIDPSEIRSRVENVIDILDIKSLKEKNPFQLSGGQVQRVALASIIAMEPDILVIDEPTSQLDPQGTEEVFNIISLMKKKNKTIILAEHKMEMIAEFADHVVLIRDGKVYLDGSSEKVLSDKSLIVNNTIMPQFALLGYEMESNGYYLDKIPITEDQAYAEIKKIMN